MKTEERPFYYHTFDLGKRKVVFCATHYPRMFVGGYGKIITVTDIDIGMSVCVPWDEYNDERGRGIAHGKALKNPKIHVSYSHDVDKYIIESIFDGIEKSMRKKPGKYIAGYKKKHDCTGNAIVQK